MSREEILNVEAGKKGAIAEDFKLLTRDDILYVNEHKPVWRRVRIGLLVGFWAIWLALLVALILIVVLQAKCPKKPSLNFWQSGIGYAVNPFSFKDTNQDYIGDLKGKDDFSFKQSNNLTGVEEKLSYLKDDLSVSFVIFTAISNGYVNVTGGFIGRTKNFSDIDELLGTRDELKQMIRRFHKKGVKVILPIDMGAEVVGSDQTFFDEDIASSWMNLDADGILLKGIPLRETYYVQNVTNPHKRTLKYLLQTVMEHDEVWNATFDTIKSVRVLMVEPVALTDQAQPTAFEGYLQTHDKNEGAQLTFTTRLLKKNDTGIAFEDLNVDSSITVAYPTGMPNKPRKFDLIATALSFLSKGTPIIYYGTEIGFTCQKPTIQLRKLFPMALEIPPTIDKSYLLPMPWDYSGVDFTGAEKTDPEFQKYTEDCKVSDTVLTSLASGNEKSVLNLITRLVELKRNPSLLWGDMSKMSFKKRVISSRLQVFVRSAPDFQPFVIAINDPSIAESKYNLGSVIDLSELCSTLRVKFVHSTDSPLQVDQEVNAERVLITASNDAAIYVFECV